MNFFIIYDNKELSFYLGNVFMNNVAAQRFKNENEKFCSDCAANINVKAEICPKCGVRQMAVSNGFVSAQNGKSKVIAAVLAFFLGGLGIHKFYLGQIGMGIIYLLFCWTFIPTIIAFIEFVILLLMSDAEFNRKYGGI